MSYDERSPENSLAITRPVLNYGEPESQKLKERLVKTGEIQEYKLVRHILRPGRKPKADLIERAEFKHFINHIGIGGGEGTSESHIEELAEYMREELAKGTKDELDSLSLPIGQRRFGSGKVLFVAVNPKILAERERAKAALAKYYGLDKVPREPWSHDRSTAGVWLAQSFRSAHQGLVDEAEGLLRNDLDLLPYRMRFGKIAVDPIIPKE